MHDDCKTGKYKGTIYSVRLMQDRIMDFVADHGLERTDAEYGNSMGIGDRCSLLMLPCDSGVQGMIISLVWSHPGTGWEADCSVFATEMGTCQLHKNTTLLISEMNSSRGMPAGQHDTADNQAILPCHVYLYSDQTCHHVREYPLSYCGPS